MKKDIKEVMALASKGPFRVETVRTSCGVCHKIGPFPSEDGEGRNACIYSDGRDSAFSVEYKTNAALIAHCLNELPKLLEALENEKRLREDYRRYADETSNTYEAWLDSRISQDIATAEALESAQEVEVPE